MDKFEREKVLDFAMVVSFLVDNVEDLLEEYKYNGELTDKQLSKTRRKIRILKEREKEVIKVLGIEGEE